MDKMPRRVHLHDRKLVQTPHTSLDTLSASKLMFYFAQDLPLLEVATPVLIPRDREMASGKDPLLVKDTNVGNAGNGVGQ
jgi:hypothetical protein